MRNDESGKKQVSFCLTCPIIPKKNSFKVGVAKGGRPYQYRSQAAKASENAIAWEAAVELRRRGWRQPVAGPVELRAIFAKTRADCIGLMETLQDALQGVAYLDDSQVVKGSQEWQSLEGSGTTAIVEITEL